MMRATEALEAGVQHDELVEQIAKWSEKTEMFVTTKTMKYMVKSGRVNPVKGFFGKLLNVRPVIIVNDEGKTDLVGKPRSEKSSMKLTMKMIEKKINKQKLWGFAISHSDNKAGADWYIARMEELTGLKPRFINTASPVLGVNAGPGVVALSLMFE